MQGLTLAAITTAEKCTLMNFFVTGQQMGSEDPE